MNFFFLLFASIILISSLLVINTKNIIHSVLFLILVFCNSTGLLLIFNIEFLSIMLIIIYIGAITVLFLFVIMMLDIKQTKNNRFNYISICLFMGISFLIETFVSINFQNFQDINEYNNWIFYLDNIVNTETIGQVLYTYFSPFFLLAGIILLIALIGAIVLTIKDKKKIKQKTFRQLSRNYKNAIFLINK